MKCPRCGKELPREAKFCSGCGMPLEGELAKAAAGESGAHVPGKKLGILIVGGMVALLVLLLVLLVFLLTADTETTPVDRYFESLESGDGEGLLAAFPDAVWQEQYQTTDRQEAEAAVQAALDRLLDGTSPDISYQVEERDAWSQREIRRGNEKLADSLGEGDSLEIQEAYDLELEVTFRLEDGEGVDPGDFLGFLDGNTGGYLGSYGETQLVAVTVVQADGEWYILGGDIVPPAQDFER